MSYTKGPWFSTNDAKPYNPKARVPAFSDCGASIYAGDEDNPIEIVIGGEQDEQGGAVGVLRNEDARLIAAAPELLEALERAAGALEVAVDAAGGDRSTHRACIQARAAIAKARGQ